MIGIIAYCQRAASIGFLILYDDTEVVHGLRYLRDRMGATTFRPCGSGGSASFKRLIQVAAAMSVQPQASIPQRNTQWSGTLATYRLLNNPRVSPQAIQAPTIAWTYQQCAGRAVVLCVHDLTEFKPVHGMSATKLLQHTALAVNGDDGEVLGVLRQHWFDDPKKPKGESRTQRRGRWTRSRVWPETVTAIGSASGSGRWIHVADREADDFQMFEACGKLGHGFVIRSQHDRRLSDGGHLREAVGRMPAAGETVIDVAARSAVGLKAPPAERRPARPSRQARLTLRFGRVTLQPPQNDPRYRQPHSVYVVHAREQTPPADGGEPIEWLLLTSEPLATLTDALEVLDWYGRRGVIEEFHKAQKTGCRLEASQLQTPAAFVNLAAIAAVVAVRLLNLRDQVDQRQRTETPATQLFDALWVLVVSRLAKHPDPSTLTVRQFYHTLARQGGWLGRRGDRRPGWQTLWRGWRKVADYVTGIQLFNATQESSTCV